MLAIQTTSKFTKDLKKRGLSAELIDVLYHLTNGKELPSKYADHQLKGQLKKYRECHVKPDLLLFYDVSEQGIVKLIALDSHANLLKM